MSEHGGDDGFDEIESLIPYDEWMIDGLRRIMYLAMWQAAEHGFAGEHHFFVNFKTKHPDVFISPSLKARFPENMQIVIQHQYTNFSVTEEQFTITLQFGGVPETLVVPFRAISKFVDPAVHFELDFEVEMVSMAPEKPASGAGPRLVTTDKNVAHIAQLRPQAKTAKTAKTTTDTENTAAHASTADPSVDAESPASTKDASNPGADTPTGGIDDGQKVVTLDAFRQKKKED